MLKKISVALLTLAMTAAMAVTATAANFTPSAVGKAAPQIATMTNAAGQSVAAIIYDANGKEIASIPAGALAVTPLSDARHADPAIEKALSAAYEQLKSTALAVLVPGLGQAVQAYSGNLAVEDLVVRDLFDISLEEAVRQQLAEGGHAIQICFALNLSPDAPLFVLHNKGGADWELISDDKIVRNDDGSVTVAFESLSPIAFLTDSGSIDADPNGPNSPQTGNAPGSVLLWSVTGTGVAALAALVLALRKRTAAR
ncbi:MAG: hypothetical protein ACOX0U_05980 [Oscillospiraceae bacterium]|jgi:hypothetical protein